MLTPIYVAETGCSISGTTITKSGTAANDCMTFDEATEEPSIPLASGDVKTISAHDPGAKAWALWRATWNGTTWVREGSALQEEGTLTSNLTVAVVPPDESLEHSEDTLTTDNLTMSLNTFHKITCSGITAQRDLIVPSGKRDGDRIRFMLVTDAHATRGRELRLIGDTGVTLVLDGTDRTATADDKFRYFIDGESAELVWDQTDSKWYLPKHLDGRIAQAAKAYLGTTTTGGEAAAADYTEIHLDTDVYDVGGIIQTSGDIKRFEVRRDGRYIAYGRGAISDVDIGRRCLTKIEVNDGVSPTREGTGGPAYNSSQLLTIVGAIVFCEAVADAGDTVEMFVYHDSDDAKEFWGAIGQQFFGILEDLL